MPGIILIAFRSALSHREVRDLTEPVLT